MNKRKQYALNKLFNLCIVLGLLSICISAELFSIEMITWGITFAIISLLLIVLPAIFTPCCYIFDSEGVSFCYVFLPSERFLWEDIYSIEVDNICPSYTHGYGICVDFFFAFVFCLEGNSSIKRRFYDKVHIRKSFRTKYLLEKYWSGTITGYMFEDTKKWLNKRRAKKQKYIDAHFKDEIVKMERESRAQAREWMGPAIAQAKELDLTVKMKYYYITNDLKELKSRPREDYRYSVDVEIARPGEKDDNRIIVISADLLYVRFGKTSYHGVKNKKVNEELQFDVSDVLEKINEARID